MHKKKKKDEVLYVLSLNFVKTWQVLGGWVHDGDSVEVTATESETETEAEVEGDSSDDEY